MTTPDQSAIVSNWLNQQLKQPSSPVALSDYWRAVGAVEALSEMGLVSQSQREERLDLLRHSRPAGEPVEPVRAIVAVGKPLAVLEGSWVFLMSVEVWTTQVNLRLYVAADSARQAADDAYQAADAEWEANPTAVPPEPSEALLRAPLEVAADDGSILRPLGGSAGGSEERWRAERRFERSRDSRFYVISSDGGAPLTVWVCPETDRTRRAARR